MRSAPCHMQMDDSSLQNLWLDDAFHNITNPENMPWQIKEMAK